MVKIADIELGEHPLLLAPMEDVSDPPFRLLCKAEGADMMYTEFISSEGLIRSAQKSLQKLDIFAEEQPMGIQIFGHDLAAMREAARIAEAVRPAVIDINYGCPVKKVTCKGAGAGILRDLPKMQALTAAIVQQVEVPVTVKTRLGWDQESIQIIEVAQRLQEAGIKALTIHGRTRAQLYRGEADWAPIAAVKAHPEITIPIFGNGDIDSPQKALHYRERYGLDGMMIGRASIGNPWIFREIKHFFQTGEVLPPPCLATRLKVIGQHLTYGIQWKGTRQAILEMRRHYGPYLRGIPHITPFRKKLVLSDTPEQLFELLEEIGQWGKAEGH